MEQPEPGKIITGTVNKSEREESSLLAGFARATVAAVPATAV
jgi:hypothetical protein